MRPYAWVTSLVTLCLAATPSSAGLIFEIGDIEGHRIDAATMKTDRLEIKSQTRDQVFRFPAGVGALLIDWAKRDTDDTLVFSMDGSLVSSDGDDYWPSSVSQELTPLIFDYDAYAHQIACGSTPGVVEMHPLVRRTGEDALPYHRHRTLLEPETQSPQAYAYRKLAERFVAPPHCVGELTLHATAGSDDEIVTIEPRSWITMITRQWYRSIDVPSEADEWIATLPYQPLRKDLEKHWPEYRAVFPPLAALSSIVEAMAVLRAIKRDAQSVWQALLRSAPAPQRPAAGLAGRLRGHPLDLPPWRRLAHAWIGERVNTPAEANLAIGLAVETVYDLAPDPRMLELAGLSAVAARDATTAAKLELARLILDRDTAPDPASFVARCKQLFDILPHSPQGFRLRAVALKMMPRIAPDSVLLDPDLQELFSEQTRVLENDFSQRAEVACASGTDLVTWESLAQDVYSVGLLSQLSSEAYTPPPPRIIDAVACIHFHRGMAPQRGREFAYRHAHYRFLGYLLRSTSDHQTQRRIREYRTALAKVMHIHEYEQSDRDLP